MGCSERVLSSCWWMNVFRTSHTVSGIELEIRLYYVNRIKSNRIESKWNSSICWKFNKISLQLSPSLFPECPLLSLLLSSTFIPLLQFNTLSFPITRSLSISLCTLNRHKSKIEIQKSSGWIFAICRSRSLTTKINILHHQHTLDEHIRWCVK